MRIAKLDSKIENKVKKLEDFLKENGLKVLCYGKIFIEDTTKNNTYMISDPELAGEHGSCFPRCYEQERLELIDDNSNII